MRLLIGAGAVVAVLVAGGAWSVRHSPSVGNTHPGPAQPSQTAPSIRTATRFVDALASFHLSQARHLLAPGATFSGAMTTHGWPVGMRFFHETGRLLPGRCEVQPWLVRRTVVDCPYRYQLMRSGALGLGPYTGSEFRITTRNGRVIHATMDHETDTNGWSSQMWMPFAHWIVTHHPDDGAAMYPDWPQQHHWPATSAAIRLWAERTRQFVRYERHRCSTSRGQGAPVCSGQWRTG